MSSWSRTPGQAPVSDSRSLRVALISYEYPPYIEGGAGIYAGELARELASLGHSVTVFAPNRGQAPSDCMVPVGRGTARAVGFWASLPRALARATHRSGAFDIIHGNAIADLSLSRYVFDAPRVVTLHHVAGRVPPPGFAGVCHRLRDLRGESGIGPVTEGVVLRRADRVICVSGPVKDDALRFCGVRSTQVAVIPNGLPILAAPDPALVASLRRAYRPTGGALVLVVGRVEYRKGTSTLLEAFARLQLERQGARLVLAGDGPIEHYREMARRLGVQDRVYFTGHVADAVRNALYAACDVVVSASLHEGFGLTLFEAMAMGKPLVVTDTGAAAAGWISHEHGAVVPAGDVLSLRDALAGLLASPARRQAIGKSNKAYAESWASWRTVAVETQRVYREAIAERWSLQGRKVAR